MNPLPHVAAYGVLISFLIALVYDPIFIQKAIVSIQWHKGRWHDCFRFLIVTYISRPMSGIGRARWIFLVPPSSPHRKQSSVTWTDSVRTSSGDRPNTGRWPYVVCLKMGVFFCRCGSNYRSEVGRTSEGIRPVPEQVTGHRAIAGRVVNGLWTMTGRCSFDVTRTWVPSYSVLPTWHCQFITMTAPRRLRMALFDHEPARQY